ncbi:MAG: ATP-dependent DNA helicase, partial [Lachnospiraceae bacterium]|nr:ATP-dependent DNA helicase [Lachnospiraceae bacterium]
MGSIGKTDGDQIRISVRNLVEFILRSGDIDNRTGGAADPETMQMGSRMHRQIQKRMGAEYQAEVPLAQEFPCEDFIIVLEGRADGIFTKDDTVWIDEIKGVFRDLRTLEQPEEVHRAQAKCYAYIYALQNGEKQMGVQMTYASLETEDIRR